MNRLTIHYGKRIGLAIVAGPLLAMACVVMGALMYNVFIFMLAYCGTNPRLADFTATLLCAASALPILLYSVISFIDFMSKEPPKEST